MRKKIAVISFCGNLFFRIAKKKQPKITKSRTHKNLVPRGIFLGSRMETQIEDLDVKRYLGRRVPFPCFTVEGEEREHITDSLIEEWASRN